MNHLEKENYSATISDQRAAISNMMNKKPQMKSLCLRILTISPKKPNSANRRIVQITNGHFANKKISAKIPGVGHDLNPHSTILIEHAKIKDLVGVNFRAIRGKLDLKGVAGRKSSRSVYGVKKAI